MAINITAAGSAGTHTLTKVNVNLDEDYIYFAPPLSGGNSNIPTAITNDKGFIVNFGVGLRLENCTSLQDLQIILE